MKDYIPILSFLGIASGGAAAFAWAFVKGFRARETRRIERTEAAEANLSQAQKDLIEVHHLEALAWKTRYEGEHQELLDYRKAVHEKADRENAKMLLLIEENVALKSKTDLTPILQFHQDQVSINAKVVTTLDAILRRLGGKESEE